MTTLPATVHPLVSTTPGVRRWEHGTPSERWTLMAFGGGGGAEDTFLIGPFLQWWDKRTAKRDAKRTAKLEAKAARRARQAKKPGAGASR
jgi:hypothetical protein